MILKDKIALVSGASRGIGRAILEDLGRMGATVVGTGTSTQSVENINRHISELGFMGTGLLLNVADKDSVAAAFAALEQAYGRGPDILVNNAAITADNLLLRMKDGEWDNVIDTNLTGVFRLTKQCLKSMVKARFGRIITVSSVVGTMGNAGQANYAAAKAGVVGFSKSLAREVATRGITVNVIAPGYVATDMTAHLPESYKEQALASIPVGRFAEPAEIAAVAAFLASPIAGYITGETIHINGGLNMA
jgi:3-oxoacyl-[acyl-carrier protein] reductase